MDQQQKTELTLLHLKAARFLEYHKFDINKIDEMVYDMHMRHPREHTKEERVQLFTNILLDRDIQSSIREHINSERDNYLKSKGDRSKLYDLMAEEKVSRRLERVKHNKQAALKGWFYRLHPKLNHLLITQMHDTILSTINRKALAELDDDLQSEFRNSAIETLKFYDYDVESHLDVMTIELYNRMFEKLAGNITPPLCRMVIQNERKKAHESGEIAKYQAMQHTNPFGNKFLYNAYKYVKHRNHYNQQSPDTDYSEEVAKHLFSKNHANYTMKHIRDRVVLFFQEVVTPRIENEARKKAEANQVGNFSEPPEENQNDSLESSTASLSDHLNESVDEEEADSGLDLVRQIENEISTSPIKSTAMLPPSSKTVIPLKRYLPLNRTSPTIRILPSNGLMGPSAAKWQSAGKSKGTSTSMIMNKSSTTKSFSPSEMLPSTASSSGTGSTESPTASSLSQSKTTSSSTEKSAEKTEVSPSPKKIGSAPHKGFKRLCKSPTDNDDADVYPQPKKVKPIPSDDEDDEPQLKKPSEK